MEAIGAGSVKQVAEVVREHVLGAMAANPGVPQYVLAVWLGWSPSTLCRRLKEWGAASEESLVRDRR